MQERHLFEYAVIRFIPRVEREEFINVGVILFCSSRNYLQSLHLPDHEKIHRFCPDADISELHNRLLSFTKICEGGRDAGPIGALPASSRFRWLTANRSTIIQTSPVHPGLCIDPDTTLRELHKKFVD